MGMFDFVTKPVQKVVNEVKRTPQNIAAIPKKVVREVGKGANAVITAPKNLIEGSGKVVANVGSNVGSGIGGLVGNTLSGSAQGLGSIANSLLPAAKELLGRKEDFPTPPVITQAQPQQNFSQGFDFSSLIPVLLIGGGGLLLFMFINKRKK